MEQNALLAIPEDLKFVLPYVQRSVEVRAKDAAVAYFCDFYAANLIISRGYPKTLQNDGYLQDFFAHLEQEKKSLESHPAFESPRAGRIYVADFASRIFLAADNEDRAGQASRKTAKMFLIASHFFEVAKGGFGDPGAPESGWSAEFEERLKYARWKASDILKALNEGRQPHPGPPPAPMTSPPQAATQPFQISGQPPADVGHTQPAFTQPPVQPAFIQPPTQPTQLSFTQPPGQPLAFTQAPAFAQQPQQNPAPARPVPGQAPAFPSTEQIRTRAKALGEAEKHARHAASAILFEDIGTAIHNLQQSLQLLQSLK